MRKIILISLMLQTCMTSADVGGKKRIENVVQFSTNVIDTGGGNVRGEKVWRAEIRTKGYESERIKISVIKEFNNDEEYKDYLDQQRIEKRRRKILVKGIDTKILDIKGQVIKEKKMKDSKLDEKEMNDIKEKYRKKYKDEIKQDQKTIKPIGKVIKYYTPGPYRYGESDFLLEREEYYEPMKDKPVGPVFYRTRIYDANEKLLGEIENEKHIWISPDRKYVVTGERNWEIRDGHVGFYKINGKLIREYDFSGATSGIVFSKDSEYVCICMGWVEGVLFLNRKGELLWKLDIEKDLGLMDADVFVRISDDNNYIFCLPRDKGWTYHFMLIDRNGKVLWNVPNTKHSMIMDDVYFDVNKGFIILKYRAEGFVMDVLSLKTGEIIERIDMGIGPGGALLGYPKRFIGNKMLEVTTIEGKKILCKIE